MGVTQDRTASPLITTLQHPQRATPHPYFAPVSPRSSRRTHSNGFSGSTSTVTDWLFTLKTICFISPHLLWTRLSLVNPLSDLSDELRAHERRRAASFAGIPHPQTSGSWLT